MLLWNCGLVVCIVVLEQNITVITVQCLHQKRQNGSVFFCYFQRFRIIGYKFLSHRILRSFDSLRISRTDRKKHFTHTHPFWQWLRSLIFFLTFVVREHYNCKLLLFDVGFYLLTFSEEAYIWHNRYQTDEIFFIVALLGRMLPLSKSSPIWNSLVDTLSPLLIPLFMNWQSMMRCVVVQTSSFNNGNSQ